MTTLADLRAEQKRRYEAERQAVLDVTPAPELALRDWQATRDGVEEVDLTGDGAAMPDVEEVAPPEPPPQTGGGRALGGGGGGDRVGGIMTMQHMRPAVDVGEEIRQQVQRFPKKGEGRRLDGEEEREDEEYFTVKVTIVLWEDGFEVSLPGDGTLPTGERVYGVKVGQHNLPFGALNKYQDLRYEAFMNQVRSGKAPQELNQLTKWLPGRSHIHLSIVDRANIKRSTQRAPALAVQMPAPELKAPTAQPEEEGRAASPQAAAGSGEPAKPVEPAAPAGRSISRVNVLRARLVAKLGKERAAGLESILKDMPEQEAAELVRAPAMLDIRLREWEAQEREEKREAEMEAQLLRDLRAAAHAKQAPRENGTSAPAPA
eukprot:Hpha_TRINITY_DN30548_c0_g1::TRINITY_DN30548_c0_g1_i1::g.193613::m.193613